MKKLALFVTLALVLAFTMPVLADPFSDVPQDHWAYDAVEQLSQKGLVQGYPDGAFKGDRTLTRYEMAMVVARVIAKLEALQASIPQPPDLSPYATKQDLETVNKLLTEYRDELDALGVRVNNIEDSLGKLTSRVAELEKLKVHGTFRSIVNDIGLEDNNATPVPGTPGSVVGGSVVPGFDHFGGGATLRPAASATSDTSGCHEFPLIQGVSMVNRLDVNVGYDITDNVTAGGEFTLYNVFGSFTQAAHWGIAPPYGYEPGVGIGSTSFDEYYFNLNNAWFKTKGGTWNFNGQFGDFNLKNVSSNMFYGVRNAYFYDDNDIYPLHGFDFDGVLYNKVKLEAFMAMNVNAFAAPPEAGYQLLTPISQSATGMDNYLYGIWAGYDIKNLHIAGAFMRLAEDYASHPMPTATYRDEIMYGFNAKYDLRGDGTFNIFGEFAGTQFDNNLKDAVDRASGYLMNVGTDLKIGKNLAVRGVFAYTQPNYDPFGYHKTWERAYEDSFHNGWDWGTFGRAVRPGLYQPNRVGFEAGASYMFGGAGEVYGNFRYLQQIDPTNATTDEKDFSTGNRYGNQDYFFKNYSTDKGDQWTIDVGGKYDFGGKFHLFGGFEYYKFERDYATYSTDYKVSFTHLGVTYDLTEKFSVQGNFEYVKQDGIDDGGTNHDMKTMVPGFGLKYKFNNDTFLALDYKFYDVDETLPTPTDQYRANRLTTQLKVKF